ncbi:hypothetical protein [Lutibacter sp. B1]|uniref:hypothetical protein n=1 Tax=Lutibacter sp. B1 TaxID=2725996 RepID=UPI0014570B14|nr:hypothetical protein [Lutibacter sp. B1]NLP57695.1 hypothetical protein [Lutibacter sp. B1]
MKFLYVFLLIVLFLNFSCDQKKEIEKVSEKKDTIQVNSNRIVNTLGETLIPKAKTSLKDWKEYNDVDEFLLKYYNISSYEALNNAQELSDLVKLMKDSVRVEKLKQLNVTARINVLHNETLRLVDMSTIPSIKNEEIKEEVTKILEVYSALNSKINTIYKAEDIQNSLEVDTETPIELEKEKKEPLKKEFRGKVSSKTQ